ncbi:MAG: hypothetical protein ACN6OP_05890 [Pseudomonadales bacterium]
MQFDCSKGPWYIRPDHLRKVYRLVGEPLGSLAAQLDALEALERVADAQAAPVGEPVYEFRQ